MYREFYGLADKPFHATPNLDFLFLSHSHQKAVACLEYGVLEEAGVILLTGDSGTGKSVLVRHILTKFESYVKAAVISNAGFNSEQLLGKIIEAFNLKRPIEGKAQALAIIQAGLDDMRINHLKPVIIIDDAQNLSTQALEEIQQLSNLKNNDRMPAQVILAGRPELKEKLEDSALASLTQHIGITYHILPFNSEESSAYIAHRLKIAGGNPEIFDSGALEMIFRIARGNPRNINLICDQALVYGFADSIKTISSTVIAQVFKDNPNLGKSADLEKTTDDFSSETGLHPVNEAPQTTISPQNKERSENWQQRIEGRLQTLEQLISEYSKELREVIKSVFEKERQKNDDLMMKYAQLKAESRILRQKLAKKEILPPTPKSGK